MLKENRMLYFKLQAVGSFSVVFIQACSSITHSLSKIDPFWTTLCNLLEYILPLEMGNLAVAKFPSFSGNPKDKGVVGPLCLLGWAGRWSAGNHPYLTENTWILVRGEMCWWKAGLGGLVLLPVTSECFEHSEAISVWVFPGWICSSSPEERQGIKTLTRQLSPVRTWKHQQLHEHPSQRKVCALPDGICWDLSAGRWHLNTGFINFFHYCWGCRAELSFMGLLWWENCSEVPGSVKQLCL